MRNLLILFFTFLFAVTIILPLNVLAESEYIRGTIKSINRSANKLIIQDTNGFVKTIFLQDDTACYDCSKNYNSESRTSIDYLTPGTTAVFTVLQTDDGDYSTTGIVYLPPGNQMHPEWEQAWGGNQTSNQTANQYNSTVNQQDNSSQDSGYQPASPDNLEQAQGLVTSVNQGTGDITLQTLEGQQVSGKAHSQTLYYDMSKGFGLESTGNLSSVKQGDVIGVSYQRSGSQNTIEVIMFLQQGQSVDQTWMDLYNQFQGGSY